MFNLASGGLESGGGDHSSREIGGPVLGTEGERAREEKEEASLLPSFPPVQCQRSSSGDRDEF